MHVLGRTLSQELHDTSASEAKTSIADREESFGSIMSGNLGVGVGGDRLLEKTLRSSLPFAHTPGSVYPTRGFSEVTFSGERGFRYQGQAAGSNLLEEGDKHVTPQLEPCLFDLFYREPPSAQGFLVRL